jgi:branched-chain amino acid transport system permease protein
MNRRQIALLIALVILALLPLVGAPRFLVTFLGEVFILAIAAMSLDLLVGYTGLVSMGHAGLFAVGAYAAGRVALHLSPSIWLTLPAAVLAAGLIAAAMAFFALRTSNVTFLMITLAFGQMIYALAVKWNKVTGGSDGLTGIPRPTGLLVEMTGARLYWVALAAMLLVYGLLLRITRSPFGHVLVGIRENENRMRAVGADVRRYKLIAFTLAGGLAGLAGGLYAHYTQFVAPNLAFWTKSGEFMVMVIIGGSGTLIGSIFGTGVLMALQDVVSSHSERWQSIMGALFILFILFARGGLMGLWNRFRSQRPPERGETPEGVAV